MMESAPMRAINDEKKPVTADNYIRFWRLNV